jgi:hypothetical protein
MDTTPAAIELRRDHIFGYYAHLEPALADAVVDYFEESRAPAVRAFAGAARLDREGWVTVIFPGRLAEVRERLSEYGATVIVPAAGAEPENRRYLAPVEQLLALGEIEARADESEEVVMPEFSEKDIPELIRMATDDELHRAPSDTTAVWAPLNAMRALGSLRAEAAIGPLLNQLKRIDEDQADFVGGVVAMALTAIGPVAVGPTALYLANGNNGQQARTAAALALRLLGNADAEVRSECVGAITAQLARYAAQEEDFNGLLVSELIDLKATESAGVIEQAFASGRVDEMMAGDWEDVQIELGFKQRRERPRKPNEFTEMGRRFRTALGIPPIDELAGPGETGEPFDLDDAYAFEQPARPPLPIYEKPVPVRVAPKVGRNEPCPCGSGKKFKKCCGP